MWKSGEKVEKAVSEGVKKILDYLWIIMEKNVEEKGMHRNKLTVYNGVWKN